MAAAGQPFCCNQPLAAIVPDCLPAQRFLESAHLTEQLHQKWLTEDGTMRQGLSVRDKQQVGAAGLRRGHAGPEPSPMVGSIQHCRCVTCRTGCS